MLWDDFTNFSTSRFDGKFILIRLSCPLQLILVAFMRRCAKGISLARGHTKFVHQAVPDERRRGRPGMLCS